MSAYISRILSSLAAVLLFPAISFAAAPKNFSELAYSLADIINMGVGLAISFGLVLYFWGFSVNIIKFADDPDKRKAYFFWGIIILVVIMSIWGIVSMIGGAIFGAGANT